MQELVVATTNQGKFREIKDLLKDFDFKITSLADYPGAPEVVEDGKTFAQNAIKKAATIALYTRKLTLGEDSGLEVRPLENGPGIHSARYSGQGATDKRNNLKLMRSLSGLALDQRQARYRCCMALVDSEGLIGTFEGRCAGLIALRSKGSNGFGYDPLFYLPRYGKTFGELDPAVKAKVSHRARASRKIKSALLQYLRRRDRSPA